MSLEITTLFYILAFTFLNGLLAFGGIFSFFISKKSLQRIVILLVSFATGALFGGAFFHFLPEAIEKISVPKTLMLTSSGLLLFFLIEVFLHWHHCHDEDCKHKKRPFTYLILFGDGVHNFIDGLVIAGSFIISVPLGVVTSLLIMAHEFPQEIGDFGVLVYGGFSVEKALFYNFLSQLTAVVGGLIGFFFIQSKEIAIYLLPIAAGGFIYIAILDLFPEVFKEKNFFKLIMNIIFIIMGLIVLASGKLLIG